MLLAAYNPIIFSVDINVLCHLEIKGFIQPKSDVSIIVGFNKDILCAKRLQAMQSLRKGHASERILAEGSGKHSCAGSGCF